ncbi:MAG: sugar transferase [Clostridiales bacterium]|nr:sugar transferase [Clostridiales bacterium]MCF8023729.1 sugar transferase [Clostridiales bacterium]
MSFSQLPAGKKLKSISPVFIAVVDVLLINLGFLAAYWLRFTGDIPQHSFKPFLDIIPWLSIAAVIIFIGLGLYEKRRDGFFHVLRASLTAVACVFVAAIALTFWFRGFCFPRSVLLLGAVNQFILISLWRLGCWHLEKHVHGVRNLLVIGDREEVEKLLSKVLDLPYGWFKIKKVLEPSQLDELDKYTSEIDSILLVPSLPDEDKTKAFAACQGAGLEALVVPDFYDILIGNTRVTQLDDLPVMEIQDISLSAIQRILKRTMDIVISLVGIILSSPLMIACVLLIKFTSPGPVLFTQRRVGRKGQVYYLCKFRTMVQNAEQMTGPVLASDNDPRITPAGRFMRATRLDELPQLFNVLKGEMSFVGPRPERPVFVEEFKQEYPNYYYRHLVKPGITGLAQVAGKYTTLPEDKLRFDLFYIRNYSLLLDLKIILQTIPVVLSRESAAGKKDNTDKNAVIYHLVNDYKKTTARDKPVSQGSSSTKA